MANPTPIRPWFRLGAVRTAPAHAPAHAPEARPIFSIPTFRSTYSAPSSPQTHPTKPHEPTPPQPQPRVVAAYRGSAPSSPDKKVVPQTQPTKPHEPTPPPSQPQLHIVPTYRGSAPSSPDKKVASQTQPTKPHEPTPPPPQPHIVAAYRGSAPSSPDKKVAPQTQPTKPHEPTPPPPQPHIVATYRGSAPSSPDKKVAPAPSSSLPNSPIQKTSLPNTNTNHYSISSSTSSPSHKIPNTSSSAKTIQAESVYNSPIHSPRLKPTAPPPSPLILPPSQFNSETKIPKEAEQKTVLVQKTVEKPKQWLNGNGTELHRESWNHGKGKDIETNEIGYHKKVSALDSEGSGMKVITIAGENRGAYMELVHSHKQHEPKYLHKKGNDSSKINGDGVESEGLSSGGEESSGRKDKNHKGKTTSSFPMAAYMNSNVQCVNNSLLYHASCSHHDPGVRLTLSKKPHGEGYHLKKDVDDYNS
ncbi:hypothetical protein TanjilG_02523 [Lupinus angustifolius]|uniref:Uncharacterized protein n=1 Tax=Lupinus angustifolius TaxID=3871 RepID=A0A1J7IWN6_LUPAN|nr:PREDICTED: leucine-rich repeat extensin-like protein 5 [Lupinus angustifolius]OIW17234.1 hypothetical protein TanjilG_02523 [Lupinus angustifolius]